MQTFWSSIPKRCQVGLPVSIRLCPKTPIWFIPQVWGHWPWDLNKWTCCCLDNNLSGSCWNPADHLEIYQTADPDLLLTHIWFRKWHSFPSEGNLLLTVFGSLQLIDLFQKILGDKTLVAILPWPSSSLLSDELHKTSVPYKSTSPGLRCGSWNLKEWNAVTSQPDCQASPPVTSHPPQPCSPPIIDNSSYHQAASLNIQPKSTLP